MSVDYRACCAGFAPRAAPPLERSARCSSFKCSGKRRKKPRGRRRGTSRGLADGDNLDHACALIVAVAADIIPCWRWPGSRPWRPRSVDTHCFYTHCLYAYGYISD